MAKKITIDMEEDEIKLLRLIGNVTDFNGQGFDEGKNPHDREADVIYLGFIEKLNEAAKK